MKNNLIHLENDANAMKHRHRILYLWIENVRIFLFSYWQYAFIGHCEFKCVCSYSSGLRDGSHSLLASCLQC